MDTTCLNCGKHTHKPDCWAKRVKDQFCSKRCHDDWQRKRALETGRRIRKKCKVCGSAFSVERCYRKRFSTCDKPECRSVNKSKELNPNWRGGVTKSRKAAMSLTIYKRWRDAVFKRDKYTCVKCGKRGGNLNADHIKPWAFFPELRFSVKNGRTLCLRCHKKTYKENLRWRRVRVTLL